MRSRVQRKDHHPEILNVNYFRDATDEPQRVRGSNG